LSRPEQFHGFFPAAVSLKEVRHNPLAVTLHELGSASDNPDYRGCCGPDPRAHLLFNGSPASIAKRAKGTPL